MADIRILEDSPQDPCKFTYNWAKTAVDRLHQVAVFLKYEGHYKELQSAIAELFDSSETRENQADFFMDVDLFRDCLVDVFGMPYTSFHAAVVKKVTSAINLIWSWTGLDKDSSKRTRQDVERIEAAQFSKIVTAFVVATGCEINDAMDNLYSLNPNLDMEYSTYCEKSQRAEPVTKPQDPERSAASETDTPGVSQNDWWHNPSEPKPPEYKYGPLTGTQKGIGKWLGEKQTPTSRRLKQKAKAHVVFVYRNGETTWDAWFKDQRMWELADRKRQIG